MVTPSILRPFILSWEGGFVNDPDDKGGATNKGVTISTFRETFGKDKTVEDLKNITDAQWLTIFKNGYWDKWRADEIQNQSIANLLVDWAWCSGVSGIKSAQKALKVTADGIVGPKTLAAINSYGDFEKLFGILWKARKTYLNAIGKGKNAKFLKGWLNRLNGIQYKKLICNGNKVITHN